MKLSLRNLILSVALISVIFTLVSSITAGYRVNESALIEGTLETNRVYVEKLAATTDNYLTLTQQDLAYSAKEIANYLKQDTPKLLMKNEANRIREQKETFNSVLIVSAEGEIIATSPESLDVKGQILDSPGGKQALMERKPLISNPYLSITNRLIIFISHPIFDDKGNYFGFVGGSIYLKEKNILNDILGEHFYNDGSYVYVVDEDGHIIYHPQKERINDNVSENPVVSELMQGKSGAKRLINSENKDMLAGYAYMSTAKWGVVSQRPTDVSLLPAKDMMKEMFLKSLPFMFMSFLFIIFIASRIAQPLRKLADYVESSTKMNERDEIQDVRAWYYEAIQLEKALDHGLTFFHDKVNYFIEQSTTDPLTGLLNRRAMDEQTKKLVENETAFSIILLDIDHFKQVNDTYGHSIGDEVMKFIANQIRGVSRENDVCCRFGGEEFIMLLPETTLPEAFEVAERLRKRMETTVSPSGEIVTISSGIANFPNCTRLIAELIEIADKRLYMAKNNGRNTSVMGDGE